MSSYRGGIHISRAPWVVMFGTLAVLTMPRSANAQGQEVPGMVEGIVVDRVTRLAVASATVTARTSGRAVFTNAEGRFKLDAIAGGLHDFTVHAPGYAVLFQKDIRVRPRNVTTIVLKLEPHSRGSRSETLDADDPRSPQPPKKTIPFGFGIGLSAERRVASDANASDVWGLTWLPRFMGRGLGPALNLPWTDTGAVNRRGSGSTELGVIRLKPTMVGVLWQEPIGKQTSAEVQVVAGYSFNSVGKSGKEPVRAQLVVQQEVMDVDDSFAWETRLAVWRELGPRVGFMVAGRYLHTRPQFILADGTQRVWKADRITLEGGLAVTLIKAPWARDSSRARADRASLRGAHVANHTVGTTGAAIVGARDGDRFEARR
jgi:hypothetical protein